jgi:hypothetical protein
MTTEAVTIESPLVAFEVTGTLAGILRNGQMSTVGRSSGMLKRLLPPLLLLVAPFAQPAFAGRNGAPHHGAVDLSYLATQTAPIIGSSFRLISYPNEDSHPRPNGGGSGYYRYATDPHCGNNAAVLIRHGLHAAALFGSAVSRSRLDRVRDAVRAAVDCGHLRQRADNLLDEHDADVDDPDLEWRPSGFSSS